MPRRDGEKVRYCCPYCKHDIGGPEIVVTAEDVPSLIKILSSDNEDSYTRSQAAGLLGQINRPDVIQPLVNRLEQDDDSEVRAAAAEALVQLIDAGTLPPSLKDSVKNSLVSVFGKDKSVKVRSPVAKALGRIRDMTVVQPLVRALSDKSHHVRYAVADALGDIHDVAAVHPLIKALSEDQDITVREAAAKALGEIGHPDAIPTLISFLTATEELDICETAIEALAKIGRTNPAAIEPLGKMLTKSDTDASLRCAIVKALDQINQPSVLQWLFIALNDEELSVRKETVKVLGTKESSETLLPLVTALIRDRDSDVRAQALDILEKRWISYWHRKTELIIQTLQEDRQYREHIEAAIIVQAIKPPDEQLVADRYLLIDHLISQAVGKDERMTGILAQLIIESCGRSLKLAGDRINAFQAANNMSGDALRKLRIEIGGETALDPVIKELRTNLQENFQEPIRRLNTDTHRMWQTTIRYAQYGFAARMTLSIFVFVVGMVLLCVSSWRIIFGTLTTEQIYGTGVSFASGLGTMLLVVYKGPLKDIRQSVNDLGTASAAFIAYIHQVLEISHTFSFYYLNQRISYEEMRTSNDLIKAAMTATVSVLESKQ